MEELAQTNETALPGHRRGDGRGFRVRRDPCARGRWQGQDVGKGREPTRNMARGVYHGSMGEESGPQAELRRGLQARVYMVGQEVQV